MHWRVILSDAKTLISVCFLVPIIEERFFTPLRLTS